MKKVFTFMIALLSTFAVANAATATFNVTVPNDGGTDNHRQTNKVMIVGNFNGWSADKAVECTKVDATHYTVTLDEATFVGGTTLTTLSYKYVSGPSWDYVMKNADGTELAANLTYAGTSPQEDAVVYWASVWKDVTPILGTVTIDIYAPKAVTECYITGNFNDWKSPGFVGKIDSTDTKMTYDAVNSDVNGNFFSIKIYTKNTYALAYKFASGPSWAYQQVEGNLSLPDPTLLTALHDNITFQRIYPGAAALKTVTFNVVAPAGTDSIFMMGSDFGWDGKSWEPAVKNLDGTFTVSYKSDLNEYKYFSGRDWQYEECNLDGSNLAANRKADAQIAVVFADTIKSWKKTPPNALLNLDMNKYTITVNNSNIKVQGVEREVTLFDVTGRKIQAAKLNGEFISKKLMVGIYILRVDGSATKVSVK